MYITAFASIPSNRNRGYFLFRAESHGALSIRPKIPEIPGEERMERTFSGISFRNFRCTSRACPNSPENRNNRGRFPFDQKFRIFRVGERMEQTFSGVSFRNFGCTSRGWPKIPENRNNGKQCSIRHMEYPKFHSGIFC